MKPPGLNLSAIKDTSWQEYAIRFVFGGGVTVMAGLIAKHYGPVIGGLFLAFPAIFPASATMLEQSEEERAPAGEARQKARRAVRSDAAGTAMGCIALMGFAAVVWRVLPSATTWVTLMTATLIWFLIAGICWILLNRWWA